MACWLQGKAGNPGARVLANYAVTELGYNVCQPEAKL